MSVNHEPILENSPPSKSKIHIQKFAYMLSILPGSSLRNGHSVSVNHEPMLVKRSPSRSKIHIQKLA